MNFVELINFESMQELGNLIHTDFTLLDAYCTLLYVLYSDFDGKL